MIVKEDNIPSLNALSITDGFEIIEHWTLHQRCIGTPTHLGIENLLNDVFSSVCRGKFRRERSKACRLTGQPNQVFDYDRSSFSLHKWFHMEQVEMEGIRDIATLGWRWLVNWRTVNSSVVSIEASAVDATSEC
jgi:hypothetical protein